MRVGCSLVYVTFGSQLGNPFVVRNLTPGRLEPLDVERWYHLYNEEDDVFTARIRLPEAANFLQVETYFDIEDWLDHSPVQYLSHPATVNRVWVPLAREAGVQDQPEATRERTRALVKPPAAVRPHRRRALLIGIDQYPDPAARLEGCVNDVFLMSSVLQECGFAAENIRVCLNERATADAIVERLDWLLDDPRTEDELVFFFSGHGARLPTYGEGDQVDRMDETLVPHDFDWSPESCVTDDRIFNLYSQLPYETRLVMMFDCCHSGGMHRAGGQKIRGINPPDDIRHRGMYWNSALQMWEERELPPLNEGYSSDETVNQRFMGNNRCTSRLGRAMTLRTLSEGEYRGLTKGKRAPVGPYLPVVIEACQEDQYAHEYRHGVTSYGAFTYALANLLRQRKDISFEKLVEAAGDNLQKLGYVQQPQILGPAAILKSKVPWGRERS
jgi:hypothetical protein